LGEACPAKLEERSGAGGDKMWYVYIIQSVSSPAQEYTGLSEDLKQRLKDHNAG
jgi:GIY-YIG catalytic domain